MAASGRDNRIEKSANFQYGLTKGNINLSKEIMLENAFNKRIKTEF